MTLLQKLWQAISERLSSQPDPVADVKELSAQDDPVPIPDPAEMEPAALPAELARLDEPEPELELPAVPEPDEEPQPPESELPATEEPEPPSLPDLDAELPVDIEPFAGMVSDEDFPEDASLAEVAKSTDFSKIAGELFEDEHRRGPYPEPLEVLPGPVTVEAEEDDGGLRQRIEMIAAGLPDPYEPKLLPDDLRHGVAQIDSNDGSGAYTITEQVWNPNADTPAWEDGVAPASYVGATARDYQDRPGGIVDQTVTFWEQRATDGTLEVLIDVSGTGEPLWGKATAAWASGNTVTLDPCDVDEADNGLANVTAYIFTPTDAVPGPGTLAIAENDVLAYLPYGDNLGVLVNPPVAAVGHMLAVKCWQDGGTTDGDHETQCDRTYTVRTVNATGPAAGGTELGTDLLPKSRQATNFLGAMHCPPADGAGWVGVGYRDTTGTFTLFDSGEREYTTPCAE